MIDFIVNLTASQSIGGLLVAIGVFVALIYVAKEYAPGPIKAIFSPIWSLLVKLWKPATFVMFAILAIVYGSKFGAKKGAAAKRKKEVKEKMKVLEARKKKLIKEVNKEDKVAMDAIKKIQDEIDEGRKEVEEIRKDKKTATAQSEVDKWNKK